MNTIGQRIYVGSDREEVEKACRDMGANPIVYDRSSFSASRTSVEQFVLYSFPDEVLIVDAGTFLERDFFVFLKVLESVTMRGRIWFFGRSLSLYPWTIKSRCEVIVDSSKRMEKWKTWVEQTGLDEKLKKHFKYLTHYPFSIAERLILIRDPLRDFLVQLDSAGQNDFYTLGLRIKEFGEDHVLLFMEWLDKSELFSNRELSMCGFFQTEHFRKVLYSFVFSVPYEGFIFDTKKFFFHFLILYKMMRGFHDLH